MLDKLESSRRYRPLEKNWEAILEERDVIFQQYYTMSLIGEHVHRLLSNCEDICRDTEALMLDSISLDSITYEEDTTRVKKFMSRL